MKVKDSSHIPVAEGLSSNSLTLNYPILYDSHQRSYSRSGSAFFANDPDFSSAAAISREIFGHTRAYIHRD